jgi:hypothetical protein
MPTRPARRLLAVLVLPAALLVDLVASAGPAAAHNVSGGALPAPSWLLGWFGAICVLGAAVALRTSWPRARLPLGVDGAATADETTEPPVATRSRVAALGHLVGLALLGLVVAAGFVGPDEPAVNIAPLALYPVVWVALPVLCVLLGDLVRPLNPWVPVVAVVERVAGPERARRWQVGAPTWTAAATLWALAWFLFAYHRPGSPRAVGTFLLLYSAAAVVGGLRWGRGWLRTGEGVGGLSHAVGRLLRRRPGPPAPGVLALAVVWIGATAYHGVSTTTWWVDVEGATTGWTRTGINTLGLLWLTGGAAVVVLAAVRLLAARDTSDAGGRPWPRGGMVGILGLALVPLALAWLVAGELTATVLQGQNFLILLSDPIGRGWDLFHTIRFTIDYTVARGGWVRWTQEVLLLAGHVAAVVVAHDAALAVVGRRRGMRVTWAAAGLASMSIVGACLLVLR